MEPRSRFKEELERYRSLVVSESIPSLDLPPPSLSNLSSLSEKPRTPVHNSSRWYQRYPASVIERFKRPSSAHVDKPKSSRRQKSPGNRANRSHERSIHSEAPNTQAEVAKWKEFGLLMAENYQDLKKRLEVLTAEREKDKAIISKQKEQIKKLKTLLEHSQTEVEQQRKASEKPDDHRCLSLLAEQLISLRTDLDKRTQPKLMLEEELSPRSRKLSLDLDLPLGSSKSAPRLR